MTAAMRVMKTAAFRRAPSSFSVGESEGVSEYTRLAAVMMGGEGERGEEREYTRRTTRSMQRETGEIIPMISSPIEERMLLLFDILVGEFRRTGCVRSSR